jgi:uncharacterized protein YndB with AHSA1/START domain
MTDPSAALVPIVITRRYTAALADLWALWTTPEGLESWWGPPGFAVTVQQMDLRPGGTLRYTMIAQDPQMVAFMRKNGMPTATPCQATYETIMPPTLTATTARLTWRNLVDFVPGHPPYHTNMAVDFEAQGDAILMRLTFDPMHDADWTARQRMGWELELGKLETALGQGA